MKKAIVGLAAVGAIIGLRPVARRMAREMREHCEQMAAHCKQMMAGQSGGHREATGMREHCKQMNTQSGARGEAVKV